MSRVELSIAPLSAIELHDHHTGYVISKGLNPARCDNKPFFNPSSTVSREVKWSDPRLRVLLRERLR